LLPGDAYDDANGHAAAPVGAMQAAMALLVAPVALDGAVVVHEIGHSFVNPVLAEHAAVFRGPGRRLFAAVGTRMERMAYGTWEVTVNESVLRAVVVRYLLAHGGESAARRETSAQVRQGFPWTLVLADVLADYEQQRDRYPTFGDFAVQLAAGLDVVAYEEQARAVNRPRVVRVEPDPASLVDASAPALVVTFSQRMHAGSWSVVGNPDELPASQTPHFDASGTVFTLPWSLEANRQYVLGLNGDRFTNFRSEAGVPLDPVELRFRTGPPSGRRP